MLRFISILFTLQVCLVLAFGQITFTREWVTGKRSMNPHFHHQRENCVSFMPTIEFLMTIEQMQQKECGPILKGGPLPWKGNDEVTRGKGDDTYEPAPGSFTQKV